MKGKYFVEIVPMYDDDPSEKVHRMGPLTSLRAAERCERGALINLNMDRFYTRIVNAVGEEVG